MKAGNRPARSAFMLGIALRKLEASECKLNGYPTCQVPSAATRGSPDVSVAARSRWRQRKQIIPMTDLKSALAEERSMLEVCLRFRTLFRRHREREYPARSNIRHEIDTFNSPIFTFPLVTVFSDVDSYQPHRLSNVVLPLRCVYSAANNSKVEDVKHEGSLVYTEYGIRNREY